MTALTVRQELDLVLGGVSYTVKTEFSTLATVEQMTQTPAQKFGYRMLNTFDVGISEMAVIIWALILEQAKAAKDGPKNPTDVGNILFEDGFEQYFEPLAEFFLISMKGHKEHAKEAAALAKRAAEKAVAAGGGEPDKLPDPPQKG